jgi:TRAP-type C4-dicarboxylate transport system permease small subunit
MTRMLTNLCSGIDRIVSRITVVLMTILVVDVSWQVFSRYVIRNPSSFTEELATFCLIWLGLLGGAYAYRQRAHLGVDILTRKMEPVRKQRAAIFSYGVMMLFAIPVLVIGGTRLVWLTLTLNQISAALQVPMGYIYLVLPLSGVLFVLYSITFIMENLSAGIQPDTDKRD